MANNVTELPVKNFDQLDPIDNVQNSDELLIRTGDSYTKRATKINFMKEEVDARTAQDVVLQTHIDDLTSDLAGTTGLAKRDVPNGLASLDSNGLVPASQLPSYVDDVIEGYYNPADGKFYENYTPTATHDIWTDGTSFLNADTTASTRPAGMEKSVTLLGAARKHSNTFYNRVGDNWYEVTAFTSIGFTTSSTAVSTASIIKALNNATDINISYAQYEEGSYSGEITPETGKVYTDLRTKLTYRWGGSAYVIIASDLALGTTHQTAGFGDESRAAYNHSLVRGTGDVTAHNPHGLSKADIGLGDVPNVTTNNQTPTYTEPQTNEELTSGETLSTAFGKLKKIVKSFIDHINTTLSTNPHNTTKSDVGLGNVTNVATTDQITSGSTSNVTSGAVHTALAGKLGTNETAADSNYAHAIGTPSSHPAIGSSKLPVYVNASGEVTPISTLQVPTIEGNVEFTGNVTTQGDVEIDGGVEVKDDAIFRKDVAIVGNLSVSGVTTIAEQESAIASDYLITRLNNTQGLGQQGHSGIAVNNYQTNKMATMTVDGNGIWRLSASATKTSQTYTNISLFNDIYYDGLTHTTTTGPTHIITNAQSITASDTVWYADDSMYYHYNGSDWLPITSVTNGQFVYGSAVTDSGKIAALEALTKRTLLYYITVTDNAINESQNQPLLTRDEHGNISNGHLLKWDSTNMRAVDGGDANALLKYQVLPDDTDLNTITTPGAYSVSIGVASQANSHAPVTGWNQLLVIRLADNPAYIIQIDMQNERTWRRYSGYVSGAVMWNDWVSDRMQTDPNIPRMVNGKLGKNITAYYNDGTLWKRLNGTDGFALFDDIYVGDYFAMSRAITCPGSIEGTVGTEWVTIVGIDNLMYNGAGQTNWINYHHLTVMPGKGEEESPQNFGRQVMNDTDTAAGGYVSSKMNLSVIGPVTATGSTAAGATINQQLKAEFGTHLKTISELITTSIDATGINKFGNASGVSNNWAWNDVQAICPSEIEVYGSVQWSSSGFDSGTAGNQLPLFRFSRIAQNNRWQNYWLKDVASAFSFAVSAGAGVSLYVGASVTSFCVRPRFVLGA